MINKNYICNLFKYNSVSDKQNRIQTNFNRILALTNVQYR